MTTFSVGSGDCTVLIEVCDICTADAREGYIRVPKYMLSLDAKYSVLGESVAGLLLSLKPLEGEIYDIVSSYKRRIMIEELYDLLRFAGSLLKVAQVSPLYAPIRRAVLLGELYSTLLSYSLDEELLSEYYHIAEETGILESGRIQPRILKRGLGQIKENLRSGLAKVSIQISRGLRELYFRLIHRVLPKDCTASRHLDPGSYIKLPEGIYIEANLEEALRRVLGSSVECSRPMTTSSSFTCKGPRGTVVAKSYMGRLIKWIPAYFASPSPAKFYVRPRRRMSNEYIMLLRLRRIVPTPRIYAVVRGGAPAMIREFIEGVPVLDSLDKNLWALAGRTLSRIHTYEYVLGDSNPGNFVVSDSGKVYLIDAEQARRASPERIAWDLLVFTTYARLFKKPADLIVEALKEYKRNSSQLFSEALRHIPKQVSLLKMALYPLVGDPVDVIRRAAED